MSLEDPLGLPAGLDDDLDEDLPEPNRPTHLQRLAGAGTVGALLQGLDTLADLDDLAQGGAVGFGAGVEIITESFAPGTGEIFEVLGGAQDLGEGLDFLGDLW